MVDNNTITDCNLCVEVSGRRTGDPVCDGDLSWEDTFAAGTSNALFIEDNNFITTNSRAGDNERIGSFAGGRFVIRYNTFDSTGLTGGTTAMPIMFHGNAAGYYYTGCRRGQPLTEIYNNEIVGHRIDNAIAMRGGSVLIHDNNITADYGIPRGIRLSEEEGWSSSVFSPLRTQWPAEDQIHNTFIWNNKQNTLDITTIDFHTSDSYCTSSHAPDICCTGLRTGTCEDNTFIKKDRDYFIHIPAATGGKESFTSRSGASNTYPTDGTYTDPDKHHFLDTGTMTFSSFGANAYYPYTPYTYPHPLRGEADTTPPAAPTGLRIR